MENSDAVKKEKKAPQPLYVSLFWEEKGGKRESRVLAKK